MFPLSRAVHCAGMAPQPSGAQMQTPAGGSSRSPPSPRTPRLLQRCRHCSPQGPGTHARYGSHAPGTVQKVLEQVKQHFCMGVCRCAHLHTHCLHTRQCHRQTLQNKAKWVRETPGRKVKFCCSSSHGQRTGKNPT